MISGSNTVQNDSERFTADSSERTDAVPAPATGPRWEIIALLLAILIFATIRWRLREIPLERDEGEYAYAGQLMLQGIPCNPGAGMEVLL